MKRMNTQAISIRYISLVVLVIIGIGGQYLPSFAGEVIQEPTESSRNNSRIDGLFNSALAKLKQNSPYEARNLLIEASQLAPTSAGIHCNLGLAYMQIADLDKAIEEFQLSLKYLPTMTEAMVDLAECYRLQDKLDKSIEWYQKYLELRPNDLSVRQTLASVIAQSKQPASEKFGPDYLREATAGELNRWPKSQTTITVFFDRNTKVPGVRPEFIGILRDCLTEWSHALGGTITFAESTLERNADLVCRWVYQPRQGRDNLLLNERGNASLTALRGQISHATIKLLTAPSLVGGDVSEEIIRKTCLHEIGHALGIAGHSPNNNDVMFYLVESPTVSSHLSERDRATIRKMYGLD